MREHRQLCLALEAALAPAVGISGAACFGSTASVERLLEALGVDRYVLYLHDFGAVVGYLTALRRPERDFDWERMSC
jgi:pimeloyl-ACP methyl ester carboxylesterase